MSNAKKVTAITDATSATPLQIIADSVAAGNTNVDVLEKMFALYERDEARKASQEFDGAMAKFQGEVPPIPRVKKADRYYFAPYEKVMETIKPYLSKHGLSIRVSTKEHSDGYWTTICTVAHSGGHKETSEFTCPIDRENKTKINAPQQRGSANSYGRRYALSNALNLAFCDEDDDGQQAGTVYLNEEQIATIEALLTEIDADVPKFLRWCRADSVEAIALHKYKTVVTKLQQMRGE
jgi:hypothetical protein